MTDRIGQQIGNYQLVRLLGEGGFAEVYLGKHVYLSRQAAIKLLFLRVAQDNIGFFHHEACLLADLMHPHIVQVLDFGVEERTPYLIMDYAPGGSLRTRHPKGSRVLLPTVVEYVQQVAQALQYAHERKLIHRDVKPENMLIGRNGEILLSDFGIALIAQSSRSQSTKDLAGTISYMAPEQIQGHPRTASDQYALAVVAYEWLAGCLPFRGSFSEVAAQHGTMLPPSLRAQVPELPEAVEQVIFTALSKKPEQRFASVSAFARALEEASTDASGSFAHPHAVAPSSRPAAGRPMQSSRLASPDLRAEQSAPARTQSATNKPASSIPEAPPAPAAASPIQQSTPPSAVSARMLAPAAPQVSRRAVLIGAAGLATMGIVGGVTWFTRPQAQVHVQNQSHPRTQAHLQISRTRKASNTHKVSHVHNICFSSTQGTATVSMRWHGRPIVRASPLALMMRRYRCGMPAMAAGFSPTRDIATV
jgi:serine/threonine protein kinase